MSAEERAGELLLLIVETLEIPFSMAHQRIEELVGRPVYSHEMCDPGSLAREIIDGTPANMADILAKLPDNVRVVIGAI